MRKEFGLRVKSIREGMNLSKEALAKQLGVSGQYLGIIERGGSFFSIDKLKKLCDITNLSADYILFGKESSFSDTVKNSLSDFSDEEIKAGCEALNKLAIMIKNKE